MSAAIRPVSILCGLAILTVAGGWVLAERDQAEPAPASPADSAKGNQSTAKGTTAKGDQTTTSKSPKRKPTPHTPPRELKAEVLERLHQDALRHFHSDPRFGMMRIPGVVIKLKRRWKLPHFSPSELEDQKPPAFQNELDKLHKGTVKAFVTRRKATIKPQIKNGLGRRFPRNFGRGKFDPTKKVWEAKSVDMIGLLTAKHPVAYTSTTSKDKAGKVTAASKPKKRELDDFEFAALRELDKGKNLYARSHKGVVRMLGAIRAKKSCIACHEDRKSGDLFGAFSYTLREAKYVRRITIRGRQVKDYPLPYSKPRK